MIQHFMESKQVTLIRAFLTENKNQQVTFTQGLKCSRKRHDVTSLTKILVKQKQLKQEDAKEITSGVFLTEEISRANLKPQLIDGKQYLVKRK